MKWLPREELYKINPVYRPSLIHSILLGKFYRSSRENTRLIYAVVGTDASGKWNLISEEYIRAVSSQEGVFIEELLYWMPACSPAPFPREIFNRCDPEYDRVNPQPLNYIES